MVITFIQRFNALVFVKNLRLDQNITSLNKIYVQVDKTNIQVISDHTTLTKNKFNSKVSEENKELSNIYWTPKVHKHSSKARFINL